MSVRRITAEAGEATGTNANCNPMAELMALINADGLAVAYVLGTFTAPVLSPFESARSV